MLLEGVKSNLNQVILPFWKKMLDEENGGFYGEMNYDLAIDKTADKGGILNSRILWTFSNAYLVLEDASVLPYADQAYRFLRDQFIDKEFGGIYWSLDYKGNPSDTTKHSYNQAFAIYALSSYYDAAKKEEALALAKQLYELIEEKWKDAYGYQEAFQRDFSPESNDKLSENGILAEKTMNTLLHIYEAYTELYRVSGDKRVAQSMRWILSIFENKVYNKERHRLEVFFDKEMNSIIDLHSYGHDIETAWLVDRGLDVLSDAALKERIGQITKDLEQEIYKAAYDGHSVTTECENGRVLSSRVWWVQCEAIIGFYNAYQKNPERKEYKEAAENIWEFTKEHIVDSREGSEWFWEVDEKNVVNKNEPVAGAWKCPYHNSRMCYEMIKRIGRENA